VVNLNSLEELFKLRVFFILLLLLALLILVPVSVSMGVINVTAIDALKILISRVPILNNYVNTSSIPPDAVPVLMFRLRRVLVAITAGVILGAGGAAMQAVLKNPMASPFTLGISHAAALGVAVASILRVGAYTRHILLSFVNPYILPVFAFASSLIQVAVILALAYRAKLSERALILASIAMSFFYQALLSLLQYLFMNELQIALVVFWTFGDLGKADWVSTQIMLVSAVILAVYYFIRSLDLDVISLGDDVASSSGVNPKILRLEATVVSALGASIATSFIGVLAFLCLIAPHIARLVIGSSHRYLVPASMLTGALLLLLADDAGRVLISPATLPVGIVLSFIGAPLLIVLLIGRGGE
jgi:iron complex transport system permease protein